jgi:hypothetical protein
MVSQSLARHVDLMLLRCFYEMPVAWLVVLLHVSGSRPAVVCETRRCVVLRRSPFWRTVSRREGQRMGSGPSLPSGRHAPLVLRRS